MTWTCRLWLPKGTAVSESATDCRVHTIKCSDTHVECLNQPMHGISSHPMQPIAGNAVFNLMHHIVTSHASQ